MENTHAKIVHAGMEYVLMAATASIVGMNEILRIERRQPQPIKII